MARCGHTPPQGWDEKDERWKRAGARDDNGTAKRVASTHVMGREGKTGSDRMRGASGNGAGRTREAPAAGVEREQPNSQRSLANRVSGIRELKNMHEASAYFERLASQGKSLSRITEAVHWASMGKVAAKLPRGQL